MSSDFLFNLHYSLSLFKFEVDPTCGGKLYNIASAHLDSQPLWQYEIAPSHSDSITQSCCKGWQLVEDWTDPFRFYKPELCPTVAIGT
jgi:hypothetical protein